MKRPLTTASLTVLALALAACGADQDPAIEVPEGAAATTTTGGDAPSAIASFGPLELSGAAEIPGPGDEDGTASVQMFLESDGSICYAFLGIDGIDTPSAAHLHEGGSSEAGPVVLPLETPTEGSLDDCIPDQGDLVTRIQENPAGFYVNVHNAEFPDGALRGQLQG